MEKMNNSLPSWLKIKENSFVFPPAGMLEFVVFPKDGALESDKVFIVDIYAADDKSHPDGHAGWWELPMGKDESVLVCLKRGVDGTGLSLTFNGKKAEKFWVNENFNSLDRVLNMHLVVREWRSTTILFDDPLLLYPGESALPDALQEEDAVPEGMPGRWFVWPAEKRILLVFDTLQSHASQRFMGQATAVLRKNGMPFSVYAYACDAMQRTAVRPLEYLLEESGKDDVVFFVFSENGEALSLIAQLPSKKILYQAHIPDWRRVQVFDAEFARKIADIENYLDCYFAFDEICFESQSEKKYWWKKLKDFAEGELLANWKQFDIEEVKTPVSDKVSKSRNACNYLKFSKSVEPLAHSLGPIDFPVKKKISMAVKPCLPRSSSLFPPILWTTDWENIREIPSAVPEKFILSVGSFRPDKRHEDTLKIFASLAEKNPDVALVLCGWGQIRGYWEYLDFLRREIYKAADKRIIYFQNCSDGQLLWLYKHASLFMSSAEYEIPDGAVRTAVEFGLPVVAKSSDSVTAILGKSGMQFAKIERVEDIADCISELIHTSEYRHSIIKQQNKCISSCQARESIASFLSTFWNILYI